MALQPLPKQPLSQSRLLEEMTNVIVDVAEPEKIILFGSRASGTAGPHSDYDFLVVEADPFEMGRSRLQAADDVMWALSRFHVSTDILFFSVKEVEHWSQSLNHVIACAFREGKVLYERPAAS